MKLRAHDKAERVLRFLLGLDNEDIASALVVAGMRDTDVARGWALLRAMTPRSIEAAKPPPDTRPQRDAHAQLARLVAKWVLMIRAALGRKHPDVIKLLLGLIYLADEPVIVANEIVTNLARAPREAREELERRGFDHAAVAQLRALIEVATSIADADGPSSYGVDRANGEHALWEWYLHWSATARAAIRDGRLLRQLGFSPTLA